jgi:hypothetical protein
MRGILTMVATVATLALMAIGFTFWAGRPHSPDLLPDMAGALIAARPEFNRYATVIAVSKTSRGVDSMNTCCYSAEFAFRQNGSENIITAKAQFFYYENKWHLGAFWWGEPPNVRSVTVGSDSPTMNR